MSETFFQNRDCRFFPCHKINDETHFNCMFCYCPLYFVRDCGGSFSLLKNGLKDCTDCVLPHVSSGSVLDRLKKVFESSDPCRELIAGKKQVK